MVGVSALCDTHANVLTSVHIRPHSSKMPNTSRGRFPRLNDWFDRIDDGALAWLEAWNALEEESVAKNGSLSLPVVSYTRDLLQGEQLCDSIWECIRGIPHQDMKTTVKEIQQQSPHMYRVLPFILDDRLD